MTFFIVTPSYNQRRFIGQTIESVTTSEGDFDLIYWVMDGDSTDGTQNILKQYQAELSFVSKKDHGQTDAINQGIKKLLASKLNLDDTIFAYINSDDYYLPGALVKVATEFDNKKVKWLVGDAQIVDERGREIQEGTRLYKKLWRFALGLFPRVLTILNPIPQPATFIRASALDKVGQFNPALNWTMDYEYWLRMIKIVGQPKLINQQLAAFRVHSQSKGAEFNQQFAEQLKVAKKQGASKLEIGLQSGHNWLINQAYKIIKS